MENRAVSFDFWIALGGLFSGIVVGLTGMGGAAIVTPMLIFIFGVPPVATVSTDIVSSAIMKPVGAAVHLKRRTPHMRIVAWLCLGSVPGMVVGSLIFAQISTVADGNDLLRRLVGFTLLVSVGLSVMRLRLKWFRNDDPHGSVSFTRRKRIIVMIVGFFVGALVGITSVGSGTLITASLIMLFPTMFPSRLVGTDLVQAVPMLLVGALLHLGLGEVNLTVLVSLIAGQLPGAFIGARISSRYNGQALRILLLILIGSAGLALLGLAGWAVALMTAAGAILLGIPIIKQTLQDRDEEQHTVHPGEPANEITSDRSA